jgi:hypothetical protein
MTTGTKQYGTEASAFYSYKSWSGTNGKYSGPKLVWNPYTVSAKFSQQVPGKDPAYPNYYLGNQWGPSGVNWTSNDTLALLSKLSTSVRGHSFNLGVALGQGRETLDMLVSTMTRITSAVHNVKRGRIDLALRSLGAAAKADSKHRSLRLDPRRLKTTDISGMWLEIQYGWRPLLQDAYAAHDALVKLTAPPRVTRVRVSVSRSWKDFVSDTYFAHYTIKTQTSRSIIAELTEEMSAPRSLGLLNPASIAWELVPFSFVADWFIPIGTYLDSYSVLPGLHGRFLQTIKTTSSCEGYGKKLPYLGASVSNRTTDLTRTVESAITVPFPRFDNLENVISAGRVKNAIALLHQAVSK